MIKKFLILFFVLYINNGICGVTVVGTRFVINSHSQHLNIKLTNDNESDYLIKSELDNKDYIISPPLFLLPANSSNIVTVIPKEKKPFTKDKLLNLAITMIPKSTLNNDSNSISLAIRNNFRVIHRHAELKGDDLNKVKIITNNEKCILKNNSSFVFTVSSDNKNNSYAKLINIPPYEKTVLTNSNPALDCDVKVNFHDEYNDIIKSIRLTK